MNKYIESDIRDGFTLLGIGLVNIITALIKEEISEYEVETPLENSVLAQILQAFDKNVCIPFVEDDKVTLNVGDKSIYIYNIEKGCLFKI